MVFVIFGGVGKWLEIGGWDYNFRYKPDRTKFTGHIPKSIWLRIGKRGYSGGAYNGPKLINLKGWQYKVIFLQSDSSYYGTVLKRPTVVTRLCWFMRRLIARMVSGLGTVIYLRNLHDHNKTCVFTAYI
jgi:hypothetical protein